ATHPVRGEAFVSKEIVRYRPVVQLRRQAEQEGGLPGKGKVPSRLSIRELHVRGGALLGYGKTGCWQLEFSRSILPVQPPPAQRIPSQPDRLERCAVHHASFFQPHAI